MEYHLVSCCLLFQVLNCCFVFIINVQQLRIIPFIYSLMYATFLMWHLTSHSASFSSFSQHALLTLLSTFCIFILPAVSISSSCLPLSPESHRLLFSLMPFNVPPSSSPPPPRAPRGHSPPVYLWSEQILYCAAVFFCAAFTYVTGVNTNLTRIVFPD